MSEIINVVTSLEGKLQTKKVKASPYEYTIATRGKWEMVIADENVTVSAGKLQKIKVKPITVQQDTLAIPCAFSHHALATVLKVISKNGPAPIETDRIITGAYIIGQESGEIKKGDLLTLLNMYPIMFTRNATKPIVLR